MHEPPTHIYEFGDFRVDAAKRLLTKEDGESIPLTPKVFDTLLYLVEHSGKIVEKDELMSAIWADTIVEENNLSQNISILRRVLGEKRGEHRFIATVPGRGFRFVAEVKDGSKFKLQSSKLGQESEVESSESDQQAFDEESIIEDQRPKTKDERSKIFAFAALILLFGGLFYWWDWQRKNASVSSIKTVAVLPFKPLVAENRDEALELGMADTLIARLGGNQEVVVRPITSVRKYGGLEQDAVQAGRELAVDSVLDGSIQRWGDSIRVNVRLLKVADGTSLWNGTFDEKFTNIFVVQDAISKKVTAALALKLTNAERTKLEKRYTQNSEAYELYLRGRYHYFKITEPEIRKGIEFYRQAIEADPNYALAYTGMADAYRTLPIAGFESSREAFPQAKAAAERALEIDDTLADAHIVLGWAVFLFDWDWSLAEAEFKRAFELNPNNSDAHRGYAHLLSNLGRHDEAVAEIKLARELDPLTLINSALEAQFLLYAGRDDEAIARLQKTLEIEPDFWVAHTVLGRVYTRQERYDEALSKLNKARELSRGSSDPVMQLGYALAKSGRRDEARATLEELKSSAAESYVSAYSFALVYNGLGETGEALNYLEKSFQLREAQLTFIKVDSRWDNLRSEPRFIDLMKQMNFE